jgi:hypothetical protein
MSSRKKRSRKNRS